MNKFMTLLALSCFAVQAQASETRLQKIEVSADVQTVERGAEALMTDCRSCHSLKYIKYRSLANYGIDQQKIDAWRGDQPMDASVMAYMSEADAAQSFGVAPPDLSLMAKARNGGVNYVYSYLVGYFVGQDGMPGNHVYPTTRMPDVLGISGATDEAQRKPIQNRARDITSFLAWAADPHAPERKRLGYYVLAYLFALTFLLYFVKNQIWSGLK